MSRPFILLDLITLKIFCEEYRLWSSSLRNFLHEPSAPNPIKIRNVVSEKKPVQTWPGSVYYKLFCTIHLYLQRKGICFWCSFVLLLAIWGNT
jgi:hypothetical protein